MKSKIYGGFGGKDMKCERCGKVFVRKENKAVRTNGEKIYVCPECGYEEVYGKEGNDKLKSE